MILDNSITYFLQMLLFAFGFFAYWKIEPNSHASGNTWFMTLLQCGHVKVVQKTKCNIKDNNFLGFVRKIIFLLNFSIRK